MKRVLAIVMESLLALLCVLCFVFWILSAWWCHAFYVGNHRGTSGVGLNARSTPGAVEITAIHFESEPGRMAEGFNWYCDARRWSQSRGLIRHESWVWYGFGFDRSSETVKNNGPKYTNYYWAISLPLWLLAIVFGIWPWMRWRARRRKRRRLAVGLCPRCGYDLRATPDRCPECGRIA